MRVSFDTQVPCMEILEVTTPFISLCVSGIQFEFFKKCKDQIISDNKRAYNFVVHSEQQQPLCASFFFQSSCYLIMAR